MSLGKFITLEGGEGVGKTTQLKFIQQFLYQRGVSVITTREPGGTVFAEKLRQLLLQEFQETVSEKTELLLMFAAREQHLTEIIQPALQRGTWVVCDRFTDSSYAYQGGGRQIKVSSIKWLEFFIQGELVPDLTLLLDAPIELGLQRARERDESDRIESQDLAFFERVREAYLQQARRHSQRIKVIQAEQSLAAVQYQIIEHLQKLLNG